MQCLSQKLSGSHFLHKKNLLGHFKLRHNLFLKTLLLFNLPSSKVVQLSKEVEDMEIKEVIKDLEISNIKTKDVVAQCVVVLVIAVVDSGVS